MSTPSSMFFYVLESALSLAPLPRVRAALPAIEGKIMKIVVTDIGLTVVCVAQADTMKLYSQFDATPDVLIQASSMGLLKMMLDKKANLFSLGLNISGDLELAQKFQQVFNQAHFDVEDIWVALLGKSKTTWLASQISDFFTKANTANQAWQHQGKQTLEKNFLASKTEVNHFVEKTDSLRAQIDRLSAKISRL